MEIDEALHCNYSADTNVMQFPLYKLTLLGPTPLPSRISMVMERDTTSLEARSFAVGAYLKKYMSIMCIHCKQAT